MEWTEEGLDAGEGSEAGSNTALTSQGLRLSENTNLGERASYHPTIQLLGLSIQGAFPHMCVVIDMGSRISTRKGLETLHVW
jgi:hypothetical protein